MDVSDFQFSDVFAVSESAIADHGALNVSLIRDVPLFIDPFLLFNSEKPEYQLLHRQLIKYLKFLRDKSLIGHVDRGHLRAWYYFPEVSQTWLGFSKSGNRGRGLGKSFADALYGSLHHVFGDLSDERVTRGEHLEKLTVMGKGVGRDMVSDFTTNLIKGFLCAYTENFALTQINENRTKLVPVREVEFNYDTETWADRRYRLPWYRDEFVLLTPTDILTRTDTWINRRDLFKMYSHVVDSVPNDQMRAQINNYFHNVLRVSPGEKAPTKDEKDEAVEDVLREFPELVDYYIRLKEDNGEEAVNRSKAEVDDVDKLIVAAPAELVQLLKAVTEFYDVSPDTYQECHQRIDYLKRAIEDKGGHRFFWNGLERIRSENDLQWLFFLVWFGTRSNVSREVNDGRGAVDYIVSRGKDDKTLVEFKLAKNTALKRNLEKQTEIYKKASDTDTCITVILYFTEKEQDRVDRILREMGLRSNQDIVQIDARIDNKPSGSMA